MNEQAVGYIAALIDGEGTIRFGASSISLDVSSTDEDIIDRVLDFADVGNKCGPYNPPSQYGHKPKWFWKVQRREDIIYIIKTTSHLVSKRRLAEFQKVLDYYEERTPKEISCRYCENLFQQEHINSRYCSTHCVDAASYKRRKERRADA